MSIFRELFPCGIVAFLGCRVRNANPCDGMRDNSASQTSQTGTFTISPLVRLCFSFIHLFPSFARYLFAKIRTRSCIKTPRFFFGCLSYAGLGHRDVCGAKDPN